MQWEVCSKKNQTRGGREASGRGICDEEEKARAKSMASSTSGRKRRNSGGDGSGGTTSGNTSSETVTATSIMTDLPLKSLQLSPTAALGPMLGCPIDGKKICFVGRIGSLIRLKRT